MKTLVLVVLIAMMSGGVQAIGLTARLPDQQSPTDCQPITAENLDGLQPVGTLSVTGAYLIGWSGDSSLLAINTQDGITRLFETNTFTEAASAQTTTEGTVLIAMHPTQPFMVVGRTRLGLWSLPDLTQVELGDPLTPIPGGGIWAMAFSSDGHYLAASMGGESGNRVIIWDLESNHVESDFTLPELNFRSVYLAFNEDGTDLIFVTDEEVARVDIATQSVIGVNEHRSNVASAAYSPFTNVLALLTFNLGNSYMDLILFDPETLIQQRGSDRIDRGGEIGISHDGKLLVASGGREGADFTILGLNEGQPADRLVRFNRYFGNDVVRIAFSPDDRYIAMLGLNRDDMYGIAAPDLEQTIIVFGVCPE